MFVLSFIRRLFHRQPSETIWADITRWILYGTFVLVPLIYISQMSFAVEFNKTLILVILIWIAALTWSIDRYVTGTLVAPSRPLVIGLGGYVLFVAISFILSPDLYRGAVGISGLFSEGVIPLLSYGVLCYLVIVTHRTQSLTRVLRALTWGLVLGVLTTLLQRNGIFILPGSETHITRFFTVASATSIVSVTAGLSLFMSTFYSITEKKLFWRIIAGGGILISALVLYQLALLMPLYVWAGAAVIWLGILSWRSRQIPLQWVMASSLVATGLIIILIVIGLGWAPEPVSQPVSIPFGAAVNMAGQRIIHAPFWGAGPQNVFRDFAEFRPDSINATALWNLRFVKSYSAWLGIIHTLGLGAFAALVWLGVLVLRRSIRHLRTSLGSSTSGLVAVLIGIAWLGLTAYGLIGNFTVIIWMYWWTLLGLFFVVSTDQKLITVRRVSRVATLGAMMSVTTAVVLLIVFGVRVWQADRLYVRAHAEINNGAEFDSIVKSLREAIALNPYESKYYELLAQGYASQAQTVAEQSPDDLDSQQQYAQRAVQTQVEAEGADPHNPVVYESTAGLYDSLRSLVVNADRQAVAAYDRALEHDPHNPLLFLNRGRALLLAAQVQQDEGGGLTDDGRASVERALSDFQRAEQLKSDLLVADYNIALAYEILGDSQAAIDHLQAVLHRYPNQPDVIYTLATLYFDAGDLDAALDLYTQVNTLVPNYRGAYWQRSFIYEQQGKLDAARAELEILLTIDPENAQVQDRLQQLTSDQSDTAE